MKTISKKQKLWSVATIGKHRVHGHFVIGICANRAFDSLDEAIAYRDNRRASFPDRKFVIIETEKIAIALDMLG